MTSNIERVYPSEAYITVQGHQSKAMGDQLTTFSKLRLTSLIGRLSEHDRRTVERVAKFTWGFGARHRRLIYSIMGQSQTLTEKPCAIQNQ